MKSSTISLGCRRYDRTEAIIGGQIHTPGLELTVTQVDQPRVLFTRMFQGEFDAAEFSFGEYVYYLSRNQCDFVAIPVFPSKIFRHSYIFFNPASGITHPRDLSGKRIGFVEWVQTAAIWIRGTLMEEYQISPRETRWCTPQLHHWETGATDHEEVDPKDGMAVQWMDKDGQDSFQLLESALLEGQLDAIGTTGLPAAFVRGQSGIKRLFDNYRDEEIFYFRKTKIFPIMHILVVRKSAVEQDPDLPHKLFTLFVQSKREAQERLKRDFSLSIVWKTPYLEQEEDLFEGDPWAYGLSKNTPAIEKFLQYCYKQGVSARMMDPRDLFAPATWEFTEESVLAES